MSRLGLCAFIVGLASSAPSQTAQAHLLSAGRATVNVVGDKAYVVLSLYVSALRRVPSCADGVLTPEELERDGAALRAEIRRGLRIAAGGEAKPGRILVNLPSGAHHDPRAGSRELTAMIVVPLPKRGPLEFRWRRWSKALSRLKIQGTMSKEGRVIRSEVATLTATRSAHRFFVVEPARSPALGRRR